MDIKSYLLGKQASGGGGGGSSTNCGAVNQVIIDEGYEDEDGEQAVELYLTKMNGIVVSNEKTDFSYMFQDCMRLEEIGPFNTSNATTMEGMFTYCLSLETLPNMDTSNVENMNSMFFDCSSLVNAPIMDTSNVTDMYAMFVGCKSLENVPVYDTSSVTNMSGCFANCESLTDESLNNILYMLSNVSNDYTETKTLFDIFGGNIDQINKCTTLSNWTLAQSTGWTTGL